MTISDWCIVLATFLGPIVAVQLTRYLDNRKDKIQQKTLVFKILMATRAQNLSSQHVEALNMIDLTFDAKKPKEKRIIDAWKLYLNHLTQNSELTGDQIVRWNEKTAELFVDLLHEMANALGYIFDKVHIAKSVYSPKAHGILEDDQTVIRKGIRGLVEGKTILPMYVVNLPDKNKEI